MCARVWGFAESLESWLAFVACVQVRVLPEPRLSLLGCSFGGRFPPFVAGAWCYLLWGWWSLAIPGAQSYGWRGSSPFMAEGRVGAVPCRFWLQLAVHSGELGGPSPFLAERPVHAGPAIPG